MLWLSYFSSDRFRMKVSPFSFFVSLFVVAALLVVQPVSSAPSMHSLLTDGQSTLVRLKRIPMVSMFEGITFEAFYRCSGATYYYDGTGVENPIYAMGINSTQMTTANGPFITKFQTFPDGSSTLAWEFSHNITHLCASVAVRVNMAGVPEPATDPMQPRPVRIVRNCSVAFPSTATRWVHGGMSFNQVTMEMVFYQNGQRLNSQDVSDQLGPGEIPEDVQDSYYNGANFAATEDVYIGAYLPPASMGEPSRYLTKDTALDQVRIWQGPRTDYEMATSWNTSFYQNEYRMLAYVLIHGSEPAFQVNTSTPPLTAYDAATGGLLQYYRGIQTLEGQYQVATPTTAIPACNLPGCVGPKCPKGYANDDTATRCVICPKGTYQPVDGLAPSCLICPPSHYNNYTGATSCAPCPAGYVSPAGSRVIDDCTICPVGTVALPLQTQCTACTPGSANAYAGQSISAACVPCAAGKFSTDTSSTSCTWCSAGKFAAGMGYTVCPDCPEGRYAESIGSSTCAACTAGKYGNTTGATSADACQSCPPSAPQSVSGSVNVLQCYPEPCEDGYWSPPRGAACSLPCPPGNACFGGVKTTCDAGTYQENSGQSACINCEAGRYSRVTGSFNASLCIACGLSSWSAAGASACNYCGAATFVVEAANMTTDGSGAGDISQCVSDIRCGSANTTKFAYVCPLGAHSPLELSGMLENGRQAMLNRFTGSSSSSDGDSSLSTAALIIGAPTSSVFQPLRDSSTLRQDAFGADALQDRQAAAGSSDSTVNETYSLPPGTVLAMYILLPLSFFFLLIFRLTPARVALYLDRFRLHRPLNVDQAVKSRPSQLGAMWTLTFLCLAALIVVALALADNSQEITALVTPSSVARTLGMSQLPQAVVSMEITIRMIVGTEASSWCTSLADSSSSSVALRTQSGFSSPFAMRSVFTNIAGATSCNLALDCADCRLSSTSSLDLTFPLSVQLLEWEIWMSGAYPASSSRLYGVLSASQNQLLDSQGELSFSLIDAYYKDHNRDVNTGAEIEFVAYSTRTAQDSKYTTAAQTSLQFLVTRSPIATVTKLSTKLNSLQLAATILSALSSLFAVCAAVYGSLELFTQRVLRVSAGSVVDERSSGGQAYIVSDNHVLPFRKGFQTIDKQEVQMVSEHGKADPVQSKDATSSVVAAS